MTVRPEHRQQEAFQARGMPVPVMIVSVMMVPVMIVSVMMVPVMIVPVMIVPVRGDVLVVVALGRWATRRSRRRMLVWV